MARCHDDDRAQEEINAAIGTYSSSENSETNLEWMELARVNAKVEDCLAKTESCAHLVAQLMQWMDHHDPIIAFGAIETLRRVLSVSENIPREQLSNCILYVLKPVGSASHDGSSNGLRFQLLRRLIKPHLGRPTHISSSAVARERREVGDDDNDEYASNPFLTILLVHIDQIDNAVLGSFDYDMGDVTCYEALIFAGDFLKRIGPMEELQRKNLDTLNRIATSLMDRFLSFDFVGRSTFLSCAILSFIQDYTAFLRGRFDEYDDGDSECLLSAQTQHLWLRQCLQFLQQSSCMSSAFRLLNSDESSDISCQASLISAQSRYPFLQHWMQFTASMVLMLLEDGHSIDQLVCTMDPVCKMGLRPEELPCRSLLLRVLSEQDDVMIETLNTFNKITKLLAAKTHRQDLHQDNSSSNWLMNYLFDELHPDLLFADVVELLGNDHLVLLDLLTSSETIMLEYLLRYLRHLEQTWATSEATLAKAGKLENMMSVLICLHMEIGKLVVAGLFPYNPNPLMRRFQAIEALYEAE